MNSEKSNTIQLIFKIAKAGTRFFIFLGFIFLFIIVKSMYPELKAGGERQKELNVLHENELSQKYMGKVLSFTTVDGIKINFTIENGNGFIAVDTRQFKHTEIFDDELNLRDKYLNSMEKFAGVSCNPLIRDYSDKNIRSKLLREDLSNEFQPVNKKTSISQIFKDNPFPLVAIPINPPPEIAGYVDNYNGIFYNHIRFFIIKDIPPQYNMLAISINYSYTRLPSTYTYIVLK